MIRKLIKKSLKSNFFQRIVAGIIYLYMHLIYYSSRWQYIIPANYDREYFTNIQNTIMVSWHDNIMVLPHISPFQFHKKLHALVSPHNDGKIISNTMKLLGYKIIEGSSNKNAIAAVKKILKILKSGGNVVITPDGPRGPRHKINGNVIEIAKISGSVIIPFIATPTNYFRLGSWDRLIFPLPFGRITIHFDTPIVCNKNTKLELEELEHKLNKLGSL